MGALEPWHLVVILVIALLVFGPGKVAEIGGTLGKGVKDFREAVDGKSAAPPAPPPVPSTTATTEARSCPQCGSAVAADARFCARCGSTLSVTTAPRDPKAN